jgi:hypothetical protein
VLPQRQIEKEVESHGSSRITTSTKRSLTSETSLTGQSTPFDAGPFHSWDIIPEQQSEWNDLFGDFALEDPWRYCSRREPYAVSYQRHWAAIERARPVISLEKP